MLKILSLKYQFRFEMEPEETHDQQEDEFEISNYSKGVSYEESSNADDVYFDSIVGALQDIVIADSFEKMQRAFILRHVELFENAEDNRPEHAAVFKQYQTEVEAYLAKVIRPFYTATGQLRRRLQHATVPASAGKPHRPDRRATVGHAHELFEL